MFVSTKRGVAKLWTNGNIWIL